MTHLAMQPLLAADGWQTVIGLIIFIFWSALQWLGSREEAKQKPQRPRPERPQPVDLAEGAPQPQNQGPRNQEEALRSEVEDFLRRAQGKPPKSQPASQPTLQPARQQKPPQPPQPERKRLVDPAARQPSHSLRNEGVAEHVARHISTQDIAAHTRTLGAKIATADDQLESRLHKKFDHAVGRLEHLDSPTDDKSPNDDLAAEVAAMLRSPEGMRQLIIANEIMHRPEW